MEEIINKLDKMENTKLAWKDWSFEEKKKLLDIYLIISKKEAQIFNLIYNYHGCDSYEDIFRDFDSSYLEDKSTGVEIAINELESFINAQNK